MPGGSAQYVLWRRDAVGNITLVGRFHSRKQAERVCRYLKSSDGKSHWITQLITGAV